MITWQYRHEIFQFCILGLSAGALFSCLHIFRDYNEVFNLCIPRYVHGKCSYCMKIIISRGRNSGRRWTFVQHIREVQQKPPGRYYQGPIFSRNLTARWHATGRDVVAMKEYKKARNQRKYTGCINKTVGRITITLLLQAASGYY
jgi:hypothetical protein